MKKLLLVLIMVLSLTACSSTNENTSTTTTESPMETETSNKEQDMTTNSEEDDSDLLAEITNERPDNLTVVSTTISYGNQTTITTYYSGSNVRYEADYGDMGKSILIYLEEEDIMYSYLEGDTNGMKLINADASYTEDMGLMVDDEIIEDSADDSQANVTTSKETLDGQEVIYIETTSNDEEMGEMLIKTWYSTEYGLPLKYLVESNGEVVMESNTSIVDDSPIDPALFIPPTDIAFMEVDMNSMTE